MNTIFDDPLLASAKAQIVNEARSAVTAARQAGDKALIDLQMAYFCRSYPHVHDCVATRQILWEELKKFAVETLEPGERYNFTSANLELLVSKKPEVLEQLAPRPSSTPKENLVQADQKLREQLIAALIQAGVSKQYLEPNEKTGLPWVNTHSTQELQQLLVNIENRRKFELQDRKTLRQTVRQNLEKRHGVVYEPLPATYELVRKNLLGLENKTVYQLDASGLKKLLFALTKEESKKFHSVYGLDQINARLAGGQ